MSYEIGVNAARMGRFAAWEWGKAVVVEGEWTPSDHGGDRRSISNSNLNAITRYREDVAREAGMELDDMPSDNTLRTRAVAYFYAEDYRDEIAISTAYEAAVGVTAGKYDGTVAELLEEARGDDGRIRVDDVRAVLEKKPTTEPRPQDMVQHAQHAGEHLRASAREFLDRDELPDPRELENLVVALRQVVQFATLLLERVEGRDTTEYELQGLLSDATA